MTAPVVVEILYGDTATHPDWAGFCTQLGEIHVFTADGEKVATFAAGQWSRVYLANVTPTVTTPPSPFQPRDGQAF
jgi:hypothetical protein